MLDDLSLLSDEELQTRRVAVDEVFVAANQELYSLNREVERRERLYHEAVQTKVRADEASQPAQAIGEGVSTTLAPAATVTIIPE
jgi:hypothetical protein